VLRRLPWAQAMECRRKEEYDSCLAKAMAVAVTPEAIAKLVSTPRSWQKGRARGASSSVAQATADAGRGRRAPLARWLP
jgi:hypothetical protein